MKIKVYIIALMAMLLSAVTLSASSPSRVTIPLNSDWQVYPVEAPDGGEGSILACLIAGRVSSEAMVRAVWV
jgi:hypothetical protein